MALILKNVSKSYAGKPALRNVTLTIPQGEIVGLFGENGAGKTTLMHSILGFHKFDGAITLDDRPSPPRTSSGSPLPPANTPFSLHLPLRPMQIFTKSTFPGFLKSVSVVSWSFLPAHGAAAQKSVHRPEKSI